MAAPTIHNVIQAPRRTICLMVVALAGLLTIQAVALSGQPNIRLSLLMVALIQVCTIGSLVWRMRRTDYPDKIRWALLLAALCCSQLATDTQLLPLRLELHGVANLLPLVLQGGDAMLLLLVCATSFRQMNLSVTAIIDSIMTVSLIVLFYYFLLAVVSVESHNGLASALSLIHTIDFINLYLLLCSGFRLGCSVRTERRHFFMLLTTAVLVRTLSASLLNRQLLFHPSPYSQLLRTPALLVMAVLTLCALPGWLRRYRPSPLLPLIDASLSPVFLGLGLIGLSITLWSKHHLLAITGIGIAVLGYAARNVVVQTTQLLTERALKATRDELASQSRTDALTGIANRRGIDAMLQHEWSAGTRESRTVSVLMIDIDHFKAYNDHYGHPRGDACLREVATLLRENLLRPSDFIGRYGGEEFMALLPATDLDAATQVAESMRTAVEQARLAHAGDCRFVSISIGIAARRAEDLNIQALIDRADAHLYLAKQRGRNRCCASSLDGISTRSLLSGTPDPA